MPFSSLWLPVLIVTNRPRETPETPRTIPGGVWCILITPAAQKVATDAFNGFLGLPVTQKSGMWHWRRSQRPIWGRELAPSRLQPPTEGTDGIRPAAGSPTTPRECRRDHACAGGMVQRELGESGGGAGRPVGAAPTPIPRFTPVPTAAIGRVETKTEQLSPHSKLDCQLVTSNLPANCDMPALWEFG